MRMVLDILYVSVGFTGALTLMYLGRVLSRLMNPPQTVAAHFSPQGGTVDVLVREIGAARKSVALLAGRLALRPLSQALLDAKGRKVAVDVCLDATAESDPASDLHFLAENGLNPRLMRHPCLFQQAVLIDGRTLLVASFPLIGKGGRIVNDPVGALFVFKGHPELFEAFRKECDRLGDDATDAKKTETEALPEPATAGPAFVPQAYAPPALVTPVQTPPAPAAVEEPMAPPTPQPAAAIPVFVPMSRPEMPPMTMPAYSPAAVMEEEEEVRPAPMWGGYVAPPAESAPPPEEPRDDDDDGESDEDSSAPPVTMAAADLFARLRQQLAERERAA